MKNRFRGFDKIFGFTFTQQTRSKGYRTAVIIGVLLCFLLPFGIMTAVELFGDSTQEEYSGTDIKTVYVLDETASEKTDWNVLNRVGAEGYSDIAYVNAADYDEAKTNSMKESDSVIVLLTEETDGYRFQVITPESFALDEDEAWSLENFLENYMQVILTAKSGLEKEQLAELSVPSTGVVMEEIDGVETEDPYASAREALSFVLPYMNIMVLYFLVLFYGQSVASGVVVEKTSKLMDTFLVSVKPEAMILGKTLAMVCASAMQFCIWVLSLVGGFAAGYVTVKAINPGTQMAVIALLEGAGSFKDILSVPGAVIGVLLMLAGFLLYCSLASVGGAAAGKPEDLSSTNVLFSMILVISFIVTLSNSNLFGGGESLLIHLIPFTSILILPSSLLLGNADLFLGVIALLIVLITSGLIMFLAGRVYQMMSFYKGKVPKINEIIKMITAK